MPARAASRAAFAFPGAASTGPAAGGYAALTPVTGGSFTIYAASPGSWPS